jgi:hypothetical protein
MYSPLSIMSEDKQEEVEENNRKINERMRKVVHKLSK